jgi:hypothetical protein
MHGLPHTSPTATTPITPAKAPFPPPHRPRPTLLHHPSDAQRPGQALSQTTEPPPHDVRARPDVSSALGNLFPFRVLSGVWRGRFLGAIRVRGRVRGVLCVGGWRVGRGKRWVCMGCVGPFDMVWAGTWLIRRAGIVLCTNGEQAGQVKMNEHTCRAGLSSPMYLAPLSIPHVHLPLHLCHFGVLQLPRI